MCLYLSEWSFLNDYLKKHYSIDPNIKSTHFTNEMNKPLIMFKCSWVTLKVQTVYHGAHAEMPALHLYAPLHFNIQPAPKPIKPRDTKAGWQYESTARLFKSDRHQFVDSAESLWILVRVRAGPSASIGYITKRLLQTTDQYQGTVTRVHSIRERQEK